VQFLYLIHAAATFFMVGLIWFVQIVHYPLHAQVGHANFRGYQASHMKRTSFVVAIPMAIEAMGAIWFALVPMPGTPAGSGLLGAAVMLTIWSMTASIQAPQHTKLLNGFEQSLHRKLVLGNWSRTVLWSVRGIIILWALGSLFSPPNMTSL